MTKRTTTGALLVIGALVAAACGDGVLPSGPDFDAQFAHKPGQGSTVDVCHKDKTISVNSKAVAAHVAHGDTLGSCDASGPAPSIAVTSSDFTAGDPGTLEVTFDVANCNAFSYVLRTQGGDFRGVTFGGDGTRTINGTIPASDGTTTLYRVFGDCTTDGQTHSSGLFFEI